MFRYVFVSLLPDVVREVVTSMESLDDMAKTAGDILQSNASARISVLAQSSQLAHDFDDHVALASGTLLVLRLLRARPTASTRPTSAMGATPSSVTALEPVPWPGSPPGGRRETATPGGVSSRLQQLHLLN